MFSAEELPFSPACERNQDPILNVLRRFILEPVSVSVSVLEVGSGTGQHAEYFARSLKQLSWQPTDQAEYLLGLRLRLELANLNNVKAPLELDVNSDAWLAPSASEAAAFDVVYTANTLHIMNEQTVENFFKGLPRHTCASAQLFIYGPFKYQGRFTSESNAAFDESLKSRGVGSAIREFEWIVERADSVGFELLEDVAMPANNQCLVFQKGSAQGVNRF